MIRPVDLPENKITTVPIFSAEKCVVCGRHWEDGGHPIPTVYTRSSLDARELAEPICDYCVEAHDPELFAALLEDRRRFHGS